MKHHQHASTALNHGIENVQSLLQITLYNSEIQISHKIGDFCITLEMLVKILNFLRLLCKFYFQLRKKKIPMCQIKINSVFEFNTLYIYIYETIK